jgi:hypothetical protein
MLKAGLEESFTKALDFKFAWDYCKRVGLLHVGVHLAMFVMMVPVIVILSCIPFANLALITVMFLAQTHLNIQIYLEYLHRGGMAISFVPDPPEPAFPIIFPPSYPPPPPPSPPPIVAG